MKNLDQNISELYHILQKKNKINKNQLNHQMLILRLIGQKKVLQEIFLIKDNVEAVGHSQLLNNYRVLML